MEKMLFGKITGLKSPAVGSTGGVAGEGWTEITITANLGQPRREELHLGLDVTMEYSESTDANTVEKNHG